MSNNFPALPDGAHIASLTYNPYATQLSDSTGAEAASLYANLTLGQLVHGPQMFTVGFDGATTDGTVSYDYSGFDQDAYEANLATFLDAWCAYEVAVLGVTTEQAQASITVTRVWVIELDEQVLGSTVTYVVYDTMAYPAAS